MILRVFELIIIVLMEMDPVANASQQIKIVTVGDPKVGKSCAIHNFQTKVAPIHRQSTIFDSTTGTIQIDGPEHKLSIWDTTGKSEYKSVRRAVYNNADIIVIFFSVMDPASFTSATTHWFQEVKEANSNAIKVFVGNKIDLRENSGTDRVVREEVAKEEIQQGLKIKYLECSALTGQGLHDVFQYCVRQHLQQKHPDRKIRRIKTQGCCLIM